MDVDVNENTGTFSQASLLLLSFLHQTPSQNPEFERELNQLTCDVNLGADPCVYSCGIDCSDHSVVDTDIECDGELETDGHAPSNPRNLLQDVLPQVHFDLPVNAGVIRQVAAELIIIADDLNQAIMSQAAESLAKDLTRTSSLQKWQDLLGQSVAELLLNYMPGAHNEQVAMALTFSLVKAVCEHAPPLLRGLYSLLMQYISPVRNR
ncbi:BH3 interacting domain death agonist [Salminus brasiliensis]|uniref:BH3 interacting domain death agonist n=1 Tax=Salminus brasiliensis TaxID=930266 RepID=UPI003B82E9D1